MEKNRKITLGYLDNYLNNQWYHDACEVQRAQIPYDPKAKGGIRIVIDDGKYHYYTIRMLREHVERFPQPSDSWILQVISMYESYQDPSISPNAHSNENH